MAGAKGSGHGWAEWGLWTRWDVMAGKMPRGGTRSPTSDQPFCLRNAPTIPQLLHLPCLRLPQQVRAHFAAVESQLRTPGVLRIGIQIRTGDSSMLQDRGHKLDLKAFAAYFDCAKEVSVQACDGPSVMSSMGLQGCVEDGRQALGLAGRHGCFQPKPTMPKLRGPCMQVEEGRGVGYPGGVLWYLITDSHALRAQARWVPKAHMRGALFQSLVSETAGPPQLDLVPAYMHTVPTGMPTQNPDEDV